MRLLVAVSNEPLAHAIHGALLAGRHEVSLASTGSIALAAVTKELFDAVILDESLLGISTEQLIESLHNARASVKILLLTSTPLSKTIGEGSRWRALPDEYAPDRRDALQLLQRGFTRKQLRCRSRTVHGQCCR